VVVADTRLSDVDGEKGELVIGGYDAEWLAERARFEDAVALLEGALETPERPSLDADAARRVAVDLGAARASAFEALGGLGDALDAADGMDALRAAMAHLPSTTSDRGIIGAMPVFAAAWQRRRLGLPVVAPNPSLSHAADYLHMVTDGEPDPARVRALDTYLVTVIDHGMNASTFAARVITSTGSDGVSAVVGAIGALKGPLHGGAPGPVLDMLDAVGTADRAKAWLESRIAGGERIMGMGHRIYRTRDPRAAILEAALRRLSESGTADRRLLLARAVEHAAEALLAERHPDRPLKANVEFYTAVVLEAVGLVREAFTPTFAVGRVGGWVAHAKEQRLLGRLLRPASRYVGVRRRG
jgi:citrate synthase